jgi:hypothetical protein
VQRLDLEYEEGTFTRVFYMFGRLCTVINSSLNFAVYSVGGQEFKRTLVQVPKLQWLRIVYNFIAYVTNVKKILYICSVMWLPNDFFQIRIQYFSVGSGSYIICFFQKIFLTKKIYIFKLSICVEILENFISFSESFMYFGLQMLRNWPNIGRQKMNLNHPSLAAPDLEMTRVTEVIS